MEYKYDVHRSICEEIHELYLKKNMDYGDSTGKGYQDYGLVYFIIQMENKLNRLKTLYKKEKGCVDESISDTLQDLANYALIAMTEIQIQNKEDIVIEMDI